MKECEDPPSALVTLVVANYRKYSRGPYKVNDALQKAEQADESSTERLKEHKAKSSLGCCWPIYQCYFRKVISENISDARWKLESRKRR